MYLRPLGGRTIVVGEGRGEYFVSHMLMGVVGADSGTWSFPYQTSGDCFIQTTWLNGNTVKKGLWSHKLFLFGIVALFSYEIAEISINSFFINYVVDDGWMNARDAAVVLYFSGLGLFMCGHFAGSWIMSESVQRKEFYYTVCFGEQ